MRLRAITTIRRPIITHRRISGALVSGPHCSIAVLLAEFSAKERKMTDLLERAEDGIAWLTLNRPDRLNAFSPAMLLALGEALQRLGGDAGIGAIVVTGAGRGFCAGGDVKTMASRATLGVDERDEGLRWMH